MKNYILGTKQLPKATVEKFDKADMAYYNKIMANEPIAEKSFSVQELDFFFLKYLHKKYPHDSNISSIYTKLSADQNSFDGFNTPNIDDLTDYLKNIEEYKSEGRVNYHASFGRDGVIAWSDFGDSVYIEWISRQKNENWIGSLRFAESAAGKKDARGEGTKAIASLFLKYPNAEYMTYSKGGKIADTVLAVLRQGTLDGRKYTLPQQLSREDYVQANKAITGMGGKWNRSAQAHIFESEDSAAAFFKQISDSNTYKNLKQEFQFFPTPAALATKMVELARLKSGDVILEPSAGRGSIIDAILKKAKDDGLSNLKIYGIELMPDNYRVLFEKHKQSEIHIESGDFLTYYSGAKEDLFKGAKVLWEGEERAIKNTTRVGNENKYEIELDNGKSIWTDENTIRRPLPKFDKIIMNPPFSGGQDIKHLLHAWTMLKHGGVLVAIVSDSAMKNSYARNKEFAAFLEENKATVEPLKQDTFKESGTPIATNLIVLEKKSEVPADNESELDQLKKSLLKADKGYQRKAAEAVIAWMQAGRNPNDTQNTKIVADAVHSRVKELQSLVDSVNADGELMQDEMIRDLVEEYNTFKRILELYEKWINEPQFPNGKELLDLTVKEIVWAYEDLVSKTEKLTQVAREKRKVLKAKLSSAKGELKKKLKEELDAVVAEIEFVERDFIELKYLQSFGSLFEYLSADLIKEGIDEEEIREMIIPEMYSAISDEASREHYWDMLYEDVWKDVVAIYKAEKEGIPLTYSKEANMHIPVCVSALVNYVLKTKKHPQAKLVAAGYLTDQPEDILPAWSVVFGDLDMSEDQIKAVFDCRCKVYIADDDKVLHHFILPYDIGPNQPAIAEQYFDKVLIALSQSPAEFLEYEAKLIFVLDLLKR